MSSQPSNSMSIHHAAAEAAAAGATATDTTGSRNRARVSRPERRQREWTEYCLDETLPHDDIARTVWNYVQILDLSPLYAAIQVTENQAGRTAIAPEILMSLWLMATIDGIGSARQLDRMCQRDSRYRWICGGVSVNHHTLSDFRSQQAEFLEKVLVDSVAALMHQGLVPLETVAQDGMRVRASAGKSSFRRKPTLEELQQQAEEHLKRLKADNEDKSRTEADARRAAAQERAARERKERLDEALKQHQELAEKREKRKKGDGATTRVSTTDADARNMKMANGGFDPAFNVQFSTDAATQIIVGVDVTNEGTDGSEMPPMLDKLEEQFGKRPGTCLVDSAFATKESVTEVEHKGTAVIGGIPRAGQLEKNGHDPYTAQRHDTPEYIRFRERMAQPASQELFKQRPKVAEFPNAVCRNQGLRQFLVRGLQKVKAVALWHAIAFNFRRMMHLQAWPIPG
jgi:transposase